MHMNNNLNTPRNLVSNQSWPEVSQQLIQYVRSPNSDTLALDNYQLFGLHILWLITNKPSHGFIISPQTPVNQPGSCLYLSMPQLFNWINYMDPTSLLAIYHTHCGKYSWRLVLVLNPLYNPCSFSRVLELPVIHYQNNNGKFTLTFVWWWLSNFSPG